MASIKLTADGRVGKQDMQVQVHFGPLEEDLPVMFKSKEERVGSGGLEVKGCLHRIQSGSSSHIYVPVSNNTEQEMTLRKRTEGDTRAVFI